MKNVLDIIQNFQKIFLNIIDQKINVKDSQHSLKNFLKLLLHINILCQKFLSFSQKFVKFLKFLQIFLQIY